MPLSSHATKNIHTVAETVDFCPNFYHWQANVAGALPLLTKNNLSLAW